MSSNSFLVTGGTPLVGSVRVGGAKNASFKLMIASLLGQTESRLLNFSNISDVHVVAEIISYLGGRAEPKGERAYFIDGSSLSSHEIKAGDGASGRFSTMFLPVLLHKFGRAVVPAPGGDKIGARPLDRHFDGLAAMGASIREENGMFVAECQHLTGATYRFPKNTHTGTETLIMAAVLATGTTLLENAALEPEIDDLIIFLNKMGAKISRQPDRVIVIEGVEALRGAIHQIMPDRNEVVTYACAAIASKGDIVVENARAQDLTAFLHVLDQIGAGYEVGDYGVRFFYKGELTATDIVTEIHPGFMTDWQPLVATVLTQCQGVSTLTETIHPSRFQYVPALQTMGAQIEYFQPEVNNPEEFYNFYLENSKPDDKHAIRITGPSQLSGGEFTVVDLRHGATLVIAALASAATTTIHGTSQIDRGYEKLDERLRTLGAQVARI